MARTLVAETTLTFAEIGRRTGIRMVSQKAAHAGWPRHPDRHGHHGEWQVARRWERRGR